MEFSIKSTRPEKQRGACVVVGIFETREPSDAARAIDKLCGDYLTGVLKRGDMDGKLGSTLFLREIPAFKAERLLLVGLGRKNDFGEKEFMAAIRNAVKALGASGAKEASFALTGFPLGKRSSAWKIRQAVINISDALYRFDQFRKNAADAPAFKKLSFLAPPSDDAKKLGDALAQGQAIADGVAFARTLGNLPGNVCTPTYLAETALRLAEEEGVACQVLERDDMKKLGMNSLLSVAQGSHEPPKFIVLSYEGGKAGGRPFVLVGKGITFDSGGISLKPGEGMDEMKFDMSGAASVLGTLLAVARLKLPLNLTVVVPATENLPGGGATRPGDIVTSLSGQTIEILNTDAEGRLILCDALTYVERFNPELVIDVATLTGACVVALGHVATGLFANNERLALDLASAGRESFDRVWRLPLWDDYRDSLKSNFADLANVGGRPAGSITAACFLSRFAGKYRWAHLDIAGTAWKSGVEKGSTGRPVPLLTHYFLARAGRSL
ncbi:MAG: leucyl aminopeptidase [Candidatus Accumulibacter sp.]|jgi:leucyl aminopeptidase|nr:leucyl aminopeptidase [Accumulibacter sp.]